MGGSEKTSTVVGYRYYTGMHMVLCKGPVDSLRTMYMDEKVAWDGISTGGRITIDEAGLLGGEDSEGGVQGDFDIEMGKNDQGQNSYLLEKLGSLLPAFRGVLGVVFRQPYLGTSPYLKDWWFKVQRVNTRQDGIEQWYNEKAGIGSVSTEPLSLYFAIDFSLSMDTITDNGLSRFENMKTAMYDVLDYIDTRITEGALSSIDIHISGFSSGVDSIEYYGVDSVYIAFLKTWLDEQVTSGGTYFTAGVEGVSSFFNGASSNSKRIVYFITDGIPWREGFTAEEIAIEASELLFSTPNIESYGINIDLEDTTYTEYMDNTPSDGVPVIEGDDSSALTAIITAQLSGQIDMNPAHIIRECLTDPDWGMGYLESDMNEESFVYAADTLYAEGMGISLLWTGETTILEFISEITNHINAVVYVDRTNGQFCLKLIRDDYNEEDLIELKGSDIIKMDSFSRPVFSEITNSVTVNYVSYLTANDASITVQDIALIQQQGSTINTTLSYSGFSNSTNASIAAQRDLKTLSSPLVSCTLYVGRIAESLTIGDVFKLTWPSYDVEDMIMRITGIAYGNGVNNQIKITCTQDVFNQPSSPIFTGIDPDGGWVEPGGSPELPPYQTAFEAPFYKLVQFLGESSANSAIEDNENLGYLMASATRPTNGLNSRMWVKSGLVGYTESRLIDFSPHIILAEDISETQTTIAYTESSDMDVVQTLTLFQIGDEYLRLDTVDTDTKTITVARGVLDSVVAKHSAGAYGVFWDNYAKSNEVEYIESDDIDVRILTNSSLGAMDITDGVDSNVIMNSRAVRPYLMGNVQLNNSYFPDEIESGDLTISWSHRDRLQQTSGLYFGFEVGDIGPEAGTTYNLKLYNENDVLSREVTGLTNTSYEWLTEIDDSQIPAEGGTADWTPADISTDQWLDASDASTITIDTGVSEWLDKSGNNRYAIQATNSLQPAVVSNDLNNLNGISFDGVDDYLQYNQFIFDDEDRTVIAVVRQDAYGLGGGFYNVAGASTETQLGRYWDVCVESPQIAIRVAGNSVYSTTDSGTPMVLGAEWGTSLGLNAFDTKVYKNGSELTQSGGSDQVINTATSTSGLSYIGRTPNQPLMFMDGRVYEIVVVKGLLSTSDRQKVEGYLAWKWGLESNLPTGHPYEFSKPTTGGGTGVYRENAKIRIELESERDSYKSLYNYDIVTRRSGYGYNYGYLYGGN